MNKIQHIAYVSTNLKSESKPQQLNKEMDSLLTDAAETQDIHLQETNWDPYLTP